MTGEKTHAGPVAAERSQKPNGKKQVASEFDAALIPDAPDILEESICMTCAYRKTCLFLGAARRPIFQCEEFNSATDSTDSS